MRFVLTAVFFITTLFPSNAVRADERINVWPWFYNLITQGGHTITWLSPDGVFDVGIYFASGYHFGNYSMRYEELCFDGEWWVEKDQNTLHFTNPVIDPTGLIEYELYRSSGGFYYIQVKNPVRINGTQFQPEETRTKVIAYTSLGNGC